MSPKGDRKQNDTTTPAAKRRFRVEKLEERIAPKRGGKGTNNCGGGGASGESSGDGGSYTTIY